MQDKGNLIGAVMVMATVIFVVAVLAIFGPIAGGIGEQTRNVVNRMQPYANGTTNISTTPGVTTYDTHPQTSLSYNSTINASGSMLATSYQFGQLAVLGVLGGVAILGLLAVLPYLFGAMGGMGRGF